MTNLYIETASDDMAAREPALKEYDEYETPGKWLDFLVDGVLVAHVRTDFNSGEGKTEFRVLAGHTLVVRS